MKCRIVSLFLAVFLLFCFPVTAYGTENMAYVIDSAGLMTEEQRLNLEEKALDLQDTYHMDVVILTVTSLDGSTAQVYADDFFDFNGYGYGEDHSGVLFLLSMEERDWYISTSGEAVYALTDYGIQASVQEALPYLSAEFYYEGFAAWLDVLPSYFLSYADGVPVDGFADYSQEYYHGDQESIVYYNTPVYGSRSPNIFLSLILGLGAAAITVMGMRSAMNTKRPQNSASNYLTDSSYHLGTTTDTFLYSNITKSAKAPPPSSRSGGGSSVHRSSGGRSHGGGGGKF